MKTKSLWSAALLLSTCILYSQTVSTFTDGTPDDAIAIDSNGSIYASNYVGDSVFKFTTAGAMTTFVSGLNTPNGLGFNSADELYICDGQGNTIFKYDAAGVELNSYPVNGHPSGILKSHLDETMIFTRYVGNTINTLAIDGTISVLSDDVQLNGPVGLAQDENGVLYVGNYNDRIIYRVLGNGDLEYVAQLPTEGGALPNLGFITYAQGNLWGTVLGNHKIYKINPNGIDDFELFAGSVQGGGDGTIADATFSAPNGIQFNDAQDVMYITDFGSKNLRILSGITLGISDNIKSDLDFNITVNAPRDTLHVKGYLQDETYKIAVFDIGGKQVFQDKNTSEQLNFLREIDISSLPSGTYVFEISNGGSSLSKKFVK